MLYLVLLPNLKYSRKKVLKKNHARTRSKSFFQIDLNLQGKLKLILDVLVQFNHAFKFAHFVRRTSFHSAAYGRRCAFKNHRAKDGLHV